MFVARPIGEMVNTLPSQGNIHGFESHTRHHIKNTHLMMSAFFVYDTLDPKGIQSLYPLGETPHALMIKGAVAK